MFLRHKKRESSFSWNFSHMRSYNLPGEKVTSLFVLLGLVFFLVFLRMF